VIHNEAATWQIKNHRRHRRCSESHPDHLLFGRAIHSRNAEYGPDQGPLQLPHPVAGQCVLFDRLGRARARMHLLVTHWIFT